MCRTNKTTSKLKFSLKKTIHIHISFLQLSFDDPPHHHIIDRNMTLQIYSRPTATVSFPEPAGL